MGTLEVAHSTLSDAQDAYTLAVGADATVGFQGPDADPTRTFGTSIADLEAAIAALGVLDETPVSVDTMDWRRSTESERADSLAKLTAIWRERQGAVTAATNTVNVAQAAVDFLTVDLASCRSRGATLSARCAHEARPLQLNASFPGGQPLTHTETVGRKRNLQAGLDAYDGQRSTESTLTDDTTLVDIHGTYDGLL